MKDLLQSDLSTVPKITYVKEDPNSFLFLYIYI